MTEIETSKSPRIKSEESESEEERRKIEEAKKQQEADKAEQVVIMLELYEIKQRISKVQIIIDELGGSL